MSLNKRTRGKTQFSTPFFFADTSSATGDGLSGVTSASPGLVMEYRRQGQSTWTSVTPQSGKTLGSYLSRGIVADGSLAGAYEVDFPDAAYASESGVEWVALRVRGVTNMLATTLMIELDAADYSDPVRLGLTSLPNVAQGSSGALPTGNASGQVTVATLTAGAIQSFWDFLTSGLTTAGSIGKWILDNLNATVSSRASQTSADAIGAKTVNLPANPAAVSDIPTAAQIADAVLEESVDDHDGVAHSLAKYISIIKKANTIVEGTVTNAVTPTTTSFSSNVNYPTGAFKHAVLVFTNSAAINEQNSPILGYVNTNGVFTVEEPFTVAPTVGDEFIIKPTNHVHSIAAIVAGVLGQETSTSAYDSGDVGYVLRQLFTLIESDGAGGWRYKASTINLGANAPAGWINEGAIANNAITGDKIAASAVAKVTVGLFKYGDVQRWNSPANQIDVTISKV